MIVDWFGWGFEWVVCTYLTERLPVYCKVGVGVWLLRIFDLFDGDGTDGFLSKAALGFNISLCLFFRLSVHPPTLPAAGLL